MFWPDGLRLRLLTATSLQLPPAGAMSAIMASGIPIQSSAPSDMSMPPPPEPQAPAHLIAVGSIFEMVSNTLAPPRVMRAHTIFLD